MKKARILIVEDDALIAVAISRMLTKFGYEPLSPVERGEDVLESVKANAPDLILMDIRLGGVIDGIDAINEVRKQFDTPFVYMTGNSDEKTYKRAIATNPAGYISKPFVMEECREVISRALSA